MFRIRNIFLGLILIIFVAPIVVVVGVSFNARKQLLFPPQGFSFRWYSEAALESDWLSAVGTSFILALGAASVALVLAFSLALYCWRRLGWQSRILRGMGLLPFMLPPVVSALGFLVFWSSIGGYGQLYAAVISHGVFLVTLPMVMILIGLDSIDRNLIDAARVCGAGRSEVYLTVILPIVRPFMIFGFFFAFVLSFNEYIISFMLIGFTHETLPVKIFNSLRYGYTPVMAVVSTFIVLLTVGGMGLIARFGDLPRLFGAWETVEK